MRSRRLAGACLSIFVFACSSPPSSEEGTTDVASSDPSAPPSSDLANAPVASPAPPAPGVATSSGGTGTAPTPTPTPTTPTTPITPPDPNGGAGPKPTTTCSVTKDSAGFFVRSTAKSSYVAYVPASYTGAAPMRLIVGLHGCGDSAQNFATWGVNPYDTRATQQHIGISIGGRDGACWSGTDDDKVLAAVDDIASCFWVHQKKVVIAGYSSGGEIGYRVGLQHASRFAGIIIEDSGLYAAGNPDTLLAGAAWKLNVAHRTHTSDPVFPLAQVKADWAKLTAKGFPLKTSETAGDHEGTSVDWATWLIPQSAAFVAP